MVIDVPLVAELLVGGRVDQHLMARGRRAVRDDLGAQVHIALVEGRQCRACASTMHLSARRTLRCVVAVNIGLIAWTTDMP